MRNRTKLDGSVLFGFVTKFCDSVRSRFQKFWFTEPNRIIHTLSHFFSLFPLSFSFLTFFFISSLFSLTYPVSYSSSSFLFFFTLDSALSSHMAFSHPSIVVGLVGFSHLREERREMWWWVVLTAVDLQKTIIYFLFTHANLEMPNLLTLLAITIALLLCPCSKLLLNQFLFHFDCKFLCFVFVFWKV